MTLTANLRVQESAHRVLWGLKEFVPIVNDFYLRKYASRFALAAVIVDHDRAAMKYLYAYRDLSRIPEREISPLTGVPQPGSPTNPLEQLVEVIEIAVDREVDLSRAFNEIIAPIITTESFNTFVAEWKSRNPAPLCFEK